MSPPSYFANYKIADGVRLQAVFQNRLKLRIFSYHDGRTQMIPIKALVLGFELSISEFIAAMLTFLVWKTSTRTWTKSDTSSPRCQADCHEYIIRQELTPNCPGVSACCRYCGGLGLSFTDWSRLRSIVDRDKTMWDSWMLAGSKAVVLFTNNLGRTT